MRAYTQEERDSAYDNLPPPVKDFIGSTTLVNIYKGMGGKLGLNFRQMFAVSQITNLTLLGIEPESAFEANIHQFLPELSNEKTRELVADINDRIFKESRRRLQDNVREPQPEPLAKRPLTDAEYEALGKEEARKGFVPEFEKRNAEEEARQPALLEKIRIGAAEDARREREEKDQSKEAKSASVLDVQLKKLSSAPPPTPVPLPPAEKPVETKVEKLESRIAELESKTDETKAVPVYERKLAAPQISSTTPPTPSSPPAPAQANPVPQKPTAPYTGADPYREDPLA
jgi:hypothetical protein